MKGWLAFTARCWSKASSTRAIRSSCSNPRLNSACRAEALAKEGHFFQAGDRVRPDRRCPMPNVPGLRSCYDKVGRLIYFGRMLDKIRLHAAGQLPSVYHDYLGDPQFFTLDGRCCRFL